MESGAQRALFSHFISLLFMMLRCFVQVTGSSELKPKDFISPLEGLRKKYGHVTYAQGYTVGRPMYGQINEIPKAVMDSLREDALTKAKAADLVIYVGGLNKNHQQDCEGGDRISYNLPFGQDELIRSLLEVNKNMVVVLISGNAVAMPWLDAVPSVVQTWYLGTITGNALADVLSGDVNPSGKLPFTYPVKLEDCPAHAFDSLCYPGDSIKEVYKEDIWLRQKCCIRMEALRFR